MSLTFTRLALHCVQPCLLLTWKRREGMAHDRTELYLLYSKDAGASLDWSSGMACLRALSWP